MADVKYTIDVDSGPGIQGLRALQNSLKQTQDAFSGLQRVLGAFAIGAFVTNSVRMAAALDDVATASGIALKSVMGFGQAVAANGGSIDAANQGIGRFAQFISKAAEGNREAQDTFKNLGISLSDLGNLSEEDLLRKTVEGLAQTGDNATRTAKSVEIFGKSFATVDLRGVNDGLDKFIAKSAQSASAVKAAADAEQNFASAFNNLQIAVLSALEPISKFVAGLNPDTINTFITALVDLGKVALIAAGAFGAFKLANGPLKSLQGEMAAIAVEGIKLKDVLMGAATSANGPIKALGNDISAMKSAFTGVYDGSKIALGGFEKLILVGSSFLSVLGRFAGVVGIIWTVYEAVSALLKLFSFDLGAWFDNVTAKAANFLGIAYKTEAAKRAEAEAAEKSAGAATKASEAENRRRQVVEAGAEAYQKMVAELQKTVDSYMRGNDELQRRLRFEGELIGLTEDQKAVKQAQFDLEKTYLSEVGKLTDLYAEKSRSQKAEDIKMLPEIQKALQAITENYKEQIGAIEELVKSNQARLETEKQLKALSDFSDKSRIDNAKTIRDLQAEMVRSTMSETERKYYDIMRAAEESARSQIETENSRRRSLGLAAMTAEEEKKYFEVAKQGLGDVKRLIDENYRQSRTWSSGWTKAWKEYADEANNAAKTAENIFKKTTQGIEDAIVGLVKTGKFEWKSLLGSIAEEFLRSGIRKGITGLFEQLGGGGDSILGSIGKMFGLEGMFPSGGGANKGSSSSNPLYVYDVAGGGGFNRGGGMTSGGGFGGGSSSGGGWWDDITGAVGGIFDSVGGWFGDIADTVGGWFGGGGGGSSWIDDIVGGVSSLFGGWFANGGTLGAGKWGIAGENGPEMISGPATITPMQGEQYVTYNINAVDAASFKAMIAADPSFIHAVAQQGGRSLARRY